VKGSTARRFGIFSLSIAVTMAIGSLGTTTVSEAAPIASRILAPRIAIPNPLGSSETPDTPGWVARNWSGYAITGATYTSVSATWIVPTVLAPPDPDTRQFSSTWVGIDGFNDSDLIQAGTEQDWLRGSASYQAWWEILPQDETPIQMTVEPGNTMYVSITQGSPNWTITVTDRTTGETYTKLKHYAGPLSSAEWIQEAPTVGGHIASLAHDSTVDFEDITANGANPELTVADSGVMAKGKGNRVVLSTPSSPDADQNGFAVAYGSDPPLPP
jgi:hypothetical protein